MKYFYLVFTGLLLLAFGNLRAQCSANIQYTYNGLADFTFTVTDKQDTTGLATYQWTLYPDSLVLDSNAQQVQHHFDTNGTYTICLHVADSVCAFDTCLNITVTNADYHPLLDTINRWTYRGNMVPFLSEPVLGTRDADCYIPLDPYTVVMEFFTEADTIVGGVNYKTLIMPGWNSCSLGLIREDVEQRKVYFVLRGDTAETLLYDFSMMIGDTISQQFMYAWSWGSYYTSDTYRLDSVKIKQVGEANHRVFYLNPITPFAQNRTMEWVEGIGHLGCLLYPYSCNEVSSSFYGACPGFQHDFCTFLICFEHNQRVYYDACAYEASLLYPNCVTVQDTCLYYGFCGDVKNIPSLTSFTITPNPASGQAEVILDVNEGSSFSLSVLNTAGSVLVSNFYSGHLNEGLHKKTMCLQNLPAGIYLVECRSGKSATYRKLVVGH